MNFFVYVHRKASNGQVFYVGKGCRYRHKSLWNRSQHWQNIVNKHGYTIEIVESGMQEWWAFELERELILKYKDHGICNKTEGGDGASGVIVSDETKRKHKERRWTPEWRKNLSDKAKERFANPEYRSAHIDRQRVIMSKEDVKQKLRDAAIRQFSNPEARDRAKILTLKQFSNPDAVELARKKALARFDTPEKRSVHAQAKQVRCIDNGMTFGTTTLAAEWVTSWREAKSDFSQIAKACRGIVKTAYGLRWEYIIQPQSMEVLELPPAG